LAKFIKNRKKEEQSRRQKSLVLIFVNDISKMNYLQKLLTKLGEGSLILHGKMEQRTRENHLMKFRSGKVPILIATDLAARGLHIKRLDYIINYDFPPNLDTYVHRIGRTGRLGQEGTAYSYFTRNFAPMAEPLIELLKQTNQRIDPFLEKLAKEYSDHKVEKEQNK